VALEGCRPSLDPHHPFQEAFWVEGSFTVTKLLDVVTSIAVQFCQGGPCHQKAVIDAAMKPVEAWHEVVGSINVPQVHRKKISQKFNVGTCHHNIIKHLP